MLLKITELLSKKKKKKPNTTHSITAFGYGSSENTLIITVVILAFIMSGLNTCMFVSRK